MLLVHGVGGAAWQATPCNTIRLAGSSPSAPQRTIEFTGADDGGGGEWVLLGDVVGLLLLGEGATLGDSLGAGEGGTAVLMSQTSKIASLHGEQG